MSTDRRKCVRCLCDWEPRPIEWLWPGRVAAGKLTLIDGDPSQGKSLLTLDLVARLTAGRPLPDGPAFGPPQSVVLVGTEDGLGDTVRPRLQAAGADLTRVHTFDVHDANGAPRLPAFPQDYDLLRETLLETGARLVVIDPLAAVLAAAGGLSGFHVRRALGPLAALADETRAGVIMIRHLTKGGQGRRAIYRGGGAIDIIGSARTAFLVAPHPQDDSLRVLACTKINVAEPPPSLGFRIVGNDDGQSAVTWTGPVDICADDLVVPITQPRGSVEQARTFLEELLRDGPRSSDEVYRQAQEAGHSRRTIERAKAELRVRSEVQATEPGKPLGQGKQWLWRLPPAAAEDTLDYAERRKRELAEAQKESDAIMARLRARYGNNSSSQ
jgi:AAA domain